MGLPLNRGKEKPPVALRRETPQGDPGGVSSSLPGRGADAPGTHQFCVNTSPSKRSRVAISSTGRRLSLVSCLTGRPKGMTAQTA